MSAQTRRPGTDSTASTNGFERVTLDASPPNADTIVSCDVAYAYLDEIICARTFKLNTESTYSCSAVLGSRLAGLMITSNDVGQLVPFPLMVIRAYVNECTKHSEDGKASEDGNTNPALGTQSTNPSLGPYVRIHGGVELDGVTMRPFVLCKGRTSSGQERHYMMMTPTPYRAIRPIPCERLNRLQAPGTIMLQLFCGHVVQARDTFSRLGNGQVNAFLCPVVGCTEGFIPM